jgi:brefeldin A-resistance guanine nucleotide exchange factor 1
MDDPSDLRDLGNNNDSGMDAPNNGIYIVLGEINLLLANLKRNSNLSSNNSNNSNSSGSNSKYQSYYHENYYNDPLSRNFYQLKTLLNEHADLNEIDSTTFMTPFLEVIKSEETSGPVTGMALTSVSKFIAYGLVGINSETSAHCVQQIADSITHARFVGTDSSSDEVVLMKILHVLRTLMLSPIGFYLTNSSVCEIMQSCFQICFENRLTELLRRSAESMLVDMVQLLFARLPQFNKEEMKFSAANSVINSKLTMKTANAASHTAKKASTSPKSNVEQDQGEKENLLDEEGKNQGDFFKIVVFS